VANTLGRRLATGDQEAFAALYDRLALRLLRTAVTLTGSTPEAEDVVQDLFVDLARGRARLAEVADLEAYVFTMLRHSLSRRRRRAAVGRRALEMLTAARHHTGRLIQEPPAVADDGLARAVAALPQPQREVLALRFDGGLTFAEIAAIVGASINTVASRYRYALEKLRAVLP
jgi:RNA polymerase sigma-70 factor (ECF subfamily)